MKEKERKMKWQLIISRSCLLQQARQRFVSTWAQICSKSVEISIDFPNESAPLCAPCSSHPILFLLFSAIVSAIASIFAAVFPLKPGDFNGFNDYFNVFDNGFEWAKSGLSNNEYGVCDILLSPVFNTIGAAADTTATAFNLCPTPVGLEKFGDLGCDLFTVLSVQATETTITIIENKTKSGPNGPHTQTQQQQAAPAIDSIDKISPTGVGLRDSDINGCVFDVVFNEYELECDISSGMCIFSLFLCFFIFLM